MVWSCLKKIYARCQTSHTWSSLTLSVFTLHEKLRHSSGAIYHTTLPVRTQGLLHAPHAHTPLRPLHLTHLLMKWAFSLVRKRGGWLSQQAHLGCCSGSQSVLWDFGILTFRYFSPCATSCSYHSFVDFHSSLHSLLVEGMRTWLFTHPSVSPT